MLKKVNIYFKIARQVTHYIKILFHMLILCVTIIFYVLFNAYNILYIFHMLLICVSIILYVVFNAYKILFIFHVLTNLC